MIAATLLANTSRMSRCKSWSFEFMAMSCFPEACVRLPLLWVVHSEQEHANFACNASRYGHHVSGPPVMDKC